MNDRKRPDNPKQGSCSNCRSNQRELWDYCSTCRRERRMYFCPQCELAFEAYYYDSDGCGYVDMNI